jgi:NCS1 family nucleobase:cation symporter-1
MDDALAGTTRSGALAIEQHGIDYIPPEDRHGKPYRLLSLWFASNVQITTVATGALAVVLGLNLTWAILSILIGNLIGGLYMATHSIQGPRLGVPQMIQSRAQFGMYGAILPLVVVVIMYIGFFVLSAVLGGQALASLLHVTTAEGIVIVNAVVLVGTWFGHNLIHAYNRVMSVVSLVFFTILLVYLAAHVPAHLAPSNVNYGTVFLVISIMVSWQLTWAPYVSDYSRYLPEDTPSRRTFWYTYVGSAIGASFVMIVGALAALTAYSRIVSNAPVYLAGLFPSVKWLFLLVFAAGVVSINLENVYGAFLTFFTGISPTGESSQGSRGRVIATTAMAIIGTFVAILASSNFLTNLTNFVLFLLYFLIPWTAINLTDYYVIHRGRYVVRQFFQANGRWGRVNWTALIIFVATVAIEVPFMDTTIYVGPVAKHFEGADFAWIIGFVVAAVAYYLTTRYGTRERLVKEDLAEFDRDSATA